jgi:hypothetical protein
VNDPTPKHLEELLVTGFGASGASVTEKLASIETRLPAPLVVQLRAVFATARQLETGGTVDVSSYRRMLQSSAEQLELLALPRTKPPLETVAQPQQPVTITKPRAARSRAPKPSRLKWWLHETRKAIPARAYRLSRTWRVPGTLLGLLIGAGAGWLIAGVGGAIAGALALAIIAFFNLSESALARGLWAQTNVVSGFFALLRLLGRAALAVLAIVVVGLIVFFVTRFWNVR